MILRMKELLRNLGIQRGTYRNQPPNQISDGLPLSLDLCLYAYLMSTFLAVRLISFFCFLLALMLVS